jgi:uncharacterized membrane protein
MGMILRLLFVLALVVVPVVMWATSTGLPARVATHFGGNGLANGWMSKDGYLLFMLVMSTVFPLVVAAATGLIPAAGRSLIAKRSGTMSPERLDTTLRWLRGYATIVGSLIALFILSTHFLILEANARNPARLDNSGLMVAVATFVVLLVIWIIGLAIGLRRAMTV